MKRIVESVSFVGPNVMELQTALTKLNGMARMVSKGQYGGSSCVMVEDHKTGEEIAQAVLVEETLTDGSKVYNVQLRFSDTE